MRAPFIRLILVSVTALLVIGAMPSASLARPVSSPSDCNGGGYLRYTDENLQPFASKQDCIRYVTQGGSLVTVALGFEPAAPYGGPADSCVARLTVTGLVSFTGLGVTFAPDGSYTLVPNELVDPATILFPLTLSGGAGSVASLDGTVGSGTTQYDLYFGDFADRTVTAALDGIPAATAAVAGCSFV